MGILPCTEAEYRVGVLWRNQAGSIVTVLSRCHRSSRHDGRAVIKASSEHVTLLSKCLQTVDRISKHDKSHSSELN